MASLGRFGLRNGDGGRSEKKKGQNANRWGSNNIPLKLLLGVTCESPIRRYQKNVEKQGEKTQPDRTLEQTVDEKENCKKDKSESD